MNIRFQTALLLLTLVLVGCLQTRDSWLPDDPPPSQGEPPRPPEPPEPGRANLTLRLAPGTEQLFEADGTNALKTVEVTYSPAPAVNSGAVPESLTVTLVPGKDLALELEPGDWSFDSRGLDDDLRLLAYGNSVATVVEGEGSLELGLQPVFASATLRPLLPAAYAAPSETVTFQLHLWSAGEHLLPTTGAAIGYFTDPAGQLVVSEDGSQVSVTAPAAGQLEVTAVVQGPVLEDGVLNEAGELTAGTSLSVLPPGRLAEDWHPPALEFDQVNRGAGRLTGRAADDVGLAAVRVYEGNVLLGSSDPADGAAGAVVFHADDPERWTLAWQASAEGSHILRAVATDLSGNSAIAFQALDVLPPADHDDLATYTTVDGATDGTDESFDMTAGFCAANEFSLPGQGLQAVGAGLQAVGAIGGLLLAPDSQFAGNSVGASQVAELLGFVVTPQQHPDVTMIVLDDFGEGNYLLPQALLNTALTPSALQELALDGSITHGALVLQHLLGLFEARGYTPAGGIHQEANHGIPTLILHREASPQAGSFVLRFVNTFSRDTTQIAAGIRQVYGAAPAGQLPSWNFVVNMSFVMLPCAVTGDLAASGIASFQDYLAALAAINQVEVQELAGLITRGPLNDDLLDYMNCPFFEQDDCRATDSYADNIVHVAAAGNFGSDFTLLPAAAPTVIAVSSQDTEAGSHTTLSGFSNPGSVMAPGANYRLASHGGMTVGYAGTSFAAPVISVMTAFDLTRPQPECSSARAVESGMETPLLASQDLDGMNIPLQGGASMTAADFCESTGPDA